MSHRRFGRLAISMLSFGIVAVAIPCGIYLAMNAANVEPTPLTNLSAVPYLLRTLDEVADQSSDLGVERIALLGDSALVSYPPKRRVHARLEVIAQEIAGNTPRIRVFQLAASGMSPFDFYFLADEFAASKPDQIVYAFNLSALGDGWRRRFVRPELSGWLRISRMPEALRMPLHWIGLTSDRLIFYSGIVGLGGFEPWHFMVKEQARVGRAHSDLESWIGERFGRGTEAAFRTDRRLELQAEKILPGTNRYTPAALRNLWGMALDGVSEEHPVLELLGATLRVYARAGIATIVFTTPTNVEHMDSLDMLDEERFQRSLAALSRVVTTNGATFLDLHALLPDRAFRDPPGHFMVEGEFDGPDLLARALAPHVVTLAPGSETPD